MIQRASCIVFYFLHAIRLLADKLALNDCPLLSDDLILYVLLDLSYELEEIASLIPTQETSSIFEELCDKLVGNETYLWHLDSATHF